MKSTNVHTLQGHVFLTFVTVLSVFEFLQVVFYHKRITSSNSNLSKPRRPHRICGGNRDQGPSPSRTLIHSAVFAQQSHVKPRDRQTDTHTDRQTDSRPCYGIIDFISPHCIRSMQSNYSTSKTVK